MFVNLKGDRAPKEIVKEYYSVSRYAFKGNKVGLVYSTNYYSMWAALFEDGTLKWKHKLDKTYLDLRGYKFIDSEVDSLVAIELVNNTIKVYFFEETFTTNFCLKAIRNITFQYPLLAYAFGTRELWVQDMANNIKIYYFMAGIAGMENDCNVKTNNKDPLSLGMILDYIDYYQIGKFTYDPKASSAYIYKRRITKSELTNSKIKGFNKIQIENFEKKKAEEGVLMHLKSSIVAISLESRHVKSELKKSLSKGNVVELKSHGALFFWEYNGDKIEMMKLPYNPNNQKAIVKVYEADEDLKMVKSTIIDGKEYLFICDESKYIKILAIEENKVSVYKDYFVDTYFATYSDANGLKQYGYCNGMVYNSSGGYTLQERGKEKEGKFNCLSYWRYSLDYNTTKFPMCTEDFILFSLSPEYNSDYTKQSKYLLLTPPMNSYRIKQRDNADRENQEMFLHFDDKYILYTRYEDLYNDEYTKRGKLSFNIYLLNNEIVQTIDFPQHIRMHPPIFSQSGEFFTNDRIDSNNYAAFNQIPKLFIYKIKKTDNYMRSVSDMNALPNQQQVQAVHDNVAKVEIIKEITLPERLGQPITEYSD